MFLSVFVFVFVLLFVFMFVFCDEDEMIVGPESKSVFVERSVGKKERAEVDILGLPQKDEKCVLFEQLRGAAATIYWEEINRTISFCLDPYTRILNYRKKST